MYVFVQKYLQKIYILKIEVFLVMHAILWDKKNSLKCFKCYSQKRLHTFSKRPEIGTEEKKLFTWTIYIHVDWFFVAF